MIDWKKYIDKVYIINCPKQHEERTNSVLSELKRIGIPDDLIYNYYNIHNKLINIPVHPEYGVITNDEHFYNVSLGHYYCMKQANEFGYEKIMIIENDVVFLKDLNILEKILTIIDANIYNFDIISSTHIIDLTNIEILRNINSYYEASINFYSRQGYQKIIDLYENKYLIGIDSYELFNKENITCGKVSFPIGLQKKYIYYVFNKLLLEPIYYLYNFIVTEKEYKIFFTSYFNSIYNLVTKSIGFINIDYTHYKNTIDKQINSLNFYGNKYSEDKKYIDYIHKKYILYEDIECDINFDKCNIFNDDKYITKRL